MLKIYSPSGSEKQLADFLLEHMVARGFKASKDDVGNVIGQLGTEGPRILLCGHMDTVPGEIPIRHEDDLLYGRGSVDAKSSLAAMIAGSYLVMQRSSAPIRVTVAGVVEEEASSRGAHALISSGISYDLAVFGEPSGASNITIGYKGGVKLQVTFATSGGHSASPWVSKNSYEEAFMFWKAFKESLIDNDSPSKFSSITGCVTTAVAGDSTSNIPSQARLIIDLRIPPSIKTADMINRAEEFTGHYRKNLGGVRVEIKVNDQTEAYLAQEDSIAVRAFRWAIRNTMNCPVTLVKKTGTSDMNLFAQSTSMPMIAYGPGDSSLDHTENEHISIREYLSSVEIYASAIQHIASLAQKENSPSNVRKI
jgi:LysW-gamma-L-lysine carboxypeptidase